MVNSAQRLIIKGSARVPLPEMEQAGPTGKRTCPNCWAAGWPKACQDQYCSAQAAMDWPWGFAFAGAIFDPPTPACVLHVRLTLSKVTAHANVAFCLILLLIFISLFLLLFVTQDP